MSNDQIAALILPWAKEHHPDKYSATLQVATKEQTFRRYLIRLVEIRWEQEPGWRESVPVSVLEESAITLRAKVRGEEEVMEFKGALAPGERKYEFNEMVLPKDEFFALREAKKILDLEYIEDG